jgi:cytochrome P450
MRSDIGTNGAARIAKDVLDLRMRRLMQIASGTGIPRPGSPRESRGTAPSLVRAWSRRASGASSPPISTYVRDLFRLGPDQISMRRANAIVKPLVGSHSLLLIDRAAHTRARKIVMPAFSAELMPKYGTQIRAIVDSYIDRWNVGARFRLIDTMRRATFEMILRVMFGIDDSAEVVRVGGAINEMVKSAVVPMMVPFLRVDFGAWSPWGKFLRVQARVFEILERFVRLRRADPRLSERDDTLSLLIRANDDHGRGLSDRDLRDELLTLLAAGHETTSASLAWAFHHVLQHPDVLSRLDIERRRVTGGDLLPEHARQLELAKAVWHEALRLSGLVPFGGNS